MPKIFSDIEKDIQRNTLFEKGLQMIVERGYKSDTSSEESICQKYFQI